MPISSKAKIENQFLDVLKVGLIRPSSN